MPDQTVNRGYPYPVDTDPIDVAGDIQLLAEAVDIDSQSIYNLAVDLNHISGVPGTLQSLPQGITVEMGRITVTRAGWYFCFYEGMMEDSGAAEVIVEAYLTNGATRFATTVVRGRSASCIVMGFANMTAGGIIGASLYNASATVVSVPAAAQTNQLGAIALGSWGANLFDFSELTASPLPGLEGSPPSDPSPVADTSMSERLVALEERIAVLEAATP